MGPKKEGQTCVLGPRLVVPNPEHLKWKSNSIRGIILIMRPSWSQPISKENSDLETQSDAIYFPPAFLTFHFSLSDCLGFRVPHHRALSSRTGAQLPQWSPGCSCNHGELRIHPVKGGEIPTGLPSGKSPPPLMQCFRTGRRHSEGLATDTTKLFIFESSRIFGPGLTWLCPPTNPSPPMDCETKEFLEFLLTLLHINS